MAKIRTIKPEFWEDEKISELPLQARLLFIGLWNFADDYGVLTSSAKWIKAKVFPYDSIREQELSQWLDALVKNRMLLPFTLRGKGWYVIRRFRSHQVIDARYLKQVIPDENMKELVERIENESLNVQKNPAPISTHSAPMGSPREHIVYTSPEVEGEVEVEMELEGDREKPPPSAAKKALPGKKSVKPVKTLFRESEFFEKTRLAAALFGTAYQEANVDYYHEVANNWSDSNQGKKVDWLATLKNWMARDMTEGKFITKNFQPPQNGRKKTGGDVTNADLARAFEKIDALYPKA